MIFFTALGWGSAIFIGIKWVPWTGEVVTDTVINGFIMFIGATLGTWAWQKNTGKR